MLEKAVFFPEYESLNLAYSVNVCIVGMLEKAVFFAEYESLNLAYSVNVCIVGMLEKAVFFAEYESLNVTGVSGNLLILSTFYFIILGTIIKIVYC